MKPHPEKIHRRAALRLVRLSTLLGLPLLFPALVYAGTWTARTFDAKWYQKHGPPVICPEKAGLDVVWLLNLTQPDDGTLDHVNPGLELKPFVPTRDTPGCFVSRTFGDHRKDWDYLVAWRDKAWREAGLTPDSPLEARVAAVANAAALSFENRLDQTKTRQEANVGKHAVETIIEGSWCVGESGLMCAAAATMGLESRSAGMGDHTVCEVRVNGRWRYVENINEALPHALCSKSLIEFIENPDCAPEMPDAVKRFWRRRRNLTPIYGPGVGRYWQFKQEGGAYQLFITPETAHALYPELDRIPTVYPLSRGALNYQNVGQLDGVLKASGVVPLRVGQEGGVRKQFHLGARPASLMTELHLDASVRGDFPVDGGEWVLSVNGDRHRLRDLAGFKVEANRLVIPLPVSGLQANRRNAIELRGGGAGPQHFFPRLSLTHLTPSPEFLYDPAR